MSRFIFLFNLLILVGCGGVSSAELETLESEVMRIHDESMLGMSDIKSVQRELLKIDKDLYPSEKQVSLKNAKEYLIIADSLMWDWMHNYKKPNFNDGEKAKAYLESEFAKISRVDSLMTTAVEIGSNTLEDLKKMNITPQQHEK